jgi:hypothetical protein
MIAGEIVPLRFFIAKKICLTMKNIVQIVLLVCIAASCDSGRVRIEGHVGGSQGALIVCSPMRHGSRKAADSIRLGAEGRFKFEYKTRHGSEDFYQLKLDSQRAVTLLLRAGERVQITAHASDFPATIQADGCLQCADMLALQKKLLRSNRIIDSLVHTNIDQKELQRQVGKAYAAQKREHAAFIVGHIGSLAAAAAYYHKVGGLPLFGFAQDRFLLEKLTDSMRRAYPKSSYTMALERGLETLRAQAQQTLLEEKIAGMPALSKPEIALPDADGRIQKLSSLTGSVTLLYFWNAGQHASRLDNYELKNLYKEFAPRGLKIYQVAVASDSAQWRRCVQEQALAWINVRCPQDEACIAALNYNLDALPSNFLINKKGEIAGRNLFDQDLRSKISSLLQQ